MSFNSVQADFLQILNRDDCTPTLAQTFLTQAMTQIEREARLPCMERVLNYVSASAPMGAVSIPADFLQPIDMYVRSQSGHLYVTPTGTSSDTWFPLVHKSYRQSLLHPQTGTPCVYARNLSQVVFAGQIPAGVTARLDYYGQFTVITDPTQDNEATASIPDLIIYKALGTYAGTYFAHESAPMWEATYQQLLQSATLLAQDADFGGGPMQVSPTHGGDDGLWGY